MQNGYSDPFGGRQPAAPMYPSQNDPYGGYYPQGDPNGGYYPQGDPNGGYYPQGDPNGGYYPQGDPNGGYYPQGDPNGGYYPQGDPNGGYYPQGDPNGGYYPQDDPNGSYDPEQAQYDQWMQQAPEEDFFQEVPTQSRGSKKRKKKAPRRGGPNWGVWLKAALAAVLAGALVFLLIRTFGGGKGGTALIENGQLGETHSGDALIVRNETAYDEEGVQSIDYVADEGGRVHRGDVICYVYSTGYSTRETAALQNYRDQIKNYQQQLLAQETSYDQKMSRLETEVVERGLEVRSLVHGERGNLISQEEILAEVIDDRQDYFRSKYSSDTRMDRLFDEETTQQQRIDSWIKQKIATSESIVSFYTDGFEVALTPSTYTDYSPAEVRSMINGKRPATSSAARGRTDLYRLVQEGNYAVLLLVDDVDWNPEEGKTYKLVLEQYTDMVVDAQVLSFTRSGGELLLRLAVIGDVGDVLYMRSCTAQLGEYVDCLSVPAEALYRQNDMDGVVVMVDNRSVFVPVKVLGKQNGKAFLSPVTTGTLSVGQTVRLFK